MVGQVELAPQLSSSSTRPAVVQELLSQEAAVLRLLDGDRAAALLHLDCLWLQQGGEAKPFAEWDNDLFQVTFNRQ